MSAPDPFCKCGYRRSLHQAGQVPSGGGCNGFERSITFNDQLTPRQARATEQGELDGAA